MYIQHTYIAVKPRPSSFFLNKQKKKVKWPCGSRGAVRRLSLAMGCVHRVGACRVFQRGYWSCWRPPPRPQLLRAEPHCLWRDAAFGSRMLKPPLQRDSHGPERERRQGNSVSTMRSLRPGCPCLSWSQGQPTPPWARRQACTIWPCGYVHACPEARDVPKR